MEAMLKEEQARIRADLEVFAAKLKHHGVRKLTQHTQTYTWTLVHIQHVQTLADFTSLDFPYKTQIHTQGRGQ